MREDNPSQRSSAPQILYVEDSIHDHELFLTFLKQLGYQGAIEWVTDGLTAIEALQKRVQEALVLPALIVLDLGLPRMGGIEFLAVLRQSPVYAHLPVIILSTSKHPKDVRETQKLGVDKYFQKPACLTEFEDLIRQLVNVEFPRFGVAT